MKQREESPQSRVSRDWLSELRGVLVANRVAPSDAWDLIVAAGAAAIREDFESRTRQRARAVELLQLQSSGRLEASSSSPSAEVQPDSRVPDSQPDEYREALDRFGTWFDRVASLFEQEREEAAGLAGELERQPALRQKWLVRNVRRFQSFGLAEYLLDRSKDLWHADPGRAEELAEVCLEIAERISETKYDLSLINDLKARAWAWIANARRIRNNYRGVEEAFRAAEFYRESGSGDPLEQAVLWQLVATFRMAQHRFDEAVELLDKAAAVYRAAGQFEREVEILITKALLYQETSQHSKSETILVSILDLMGEDGDPKLTFYVYNNLALALYEMGRPQEAEALLPKVQELAETAGEMLDRLRVEWLRGSILSKAGRLEEAEKPLRRARDGFIEQGMGLDAAGACLDLIRLYLRTEREKEAVDLTGDLLPIFAAKDMNRESLSAILYLQQALREHKASLGLIDEVADFIEEARGNPMARFNPTVEA